MNLKEMMELMEAKELKEVKDLKELVLKQGSNVLGVQSSLFELEKNMGKKDNKDELELKIIELEEKTLLLEKEVKNKQRDPEELQIIRQVLLKIIEEKFTDINRSMETKIQQIKNENSQEIASLKQIIQQKDELISSLQETITKNYEEMLTLKQNINQANMKTNGIIQSIGMKLNEVDQDFGQKIQGLDQAMRKTDNKCKDLEDRIAKFDINGSDQLNKIEEFGKTLQNLIDEKAKEKEEKKLQHSQLLSIQTDFNKKVSDLRNEFFNLHHDQVEKIKKVDDLNVTIKNSVDSMKVELKFLNSSTFKKGSFVNIDNEWKVTTKYPCCGTKCVNTESPYGTCKSRNGFIQLTTDGTIRYIKCAEGKVNKFPLITAANQFKKPVNCNVFSLFYFELKLKLEEGITSDQKSLAFGLANNSDTIKMWPLSSIIHYQMQNENIPQSFTLENFTWSDDDVVGCCLIYPPSRVENKMPYVFYTQNGKQICKAIVLEGNNNYYQPFIQVTGYAVETNFGHDLDAKPFSFDISKHLVAEEFYEFY
uniref:Uncharacterized protein n=1 Tax=Meloidogyne enterolobii TaxID=390850 RepID=A0A6V7WR37_MELEN|nr:unnamed protein product [Meloidogyne enterolobii]